MVVCLLLISLSLFTGCINNAEKTNNSDKTNTIQDSTQENEEPVKLSIISDEMGRVWKEGNPVQLELEKITNTKLEVTLIPKSEFQNKYSVLAASGSLPDISCLGANDFQAYAGQGLYMDIAEQLEKHAYNLMKHIKPEEWDLCKYQGKQIGIPYLRIAGKVIPIVRQDWLDNLGIKMPETLDEYENMLIQFTKNDPDGNGKDDTYGIGAVANGVGNTFDMIFGAFGFQLKKYYLKEEKIYPANISEEYKAALEYINKLWDAGAIDPDLFIIKGDQARQRIAQGKVGSFCGWWSSVPEALEAQNKIKEINPKANLVPIYPAVKGLDGKSGMISYGNFGGARCISSKCENSETAIKFLDYLCTDEGNELVWMGIKGVHYIDVVKGRTEEGQKAFDEKWLDPFAQIISRLDIDRNTNSEDPITRRKAEFAQIATKYNLYSCIFYAEPITDEEKSLGPDLKQYEEEMLIKFITGQEPLSKWDEYIKTWIDKGGKKILESKIKIHNQINATNYTSGI